MSALSAFFPPRRPTSTMAQDRTDLLSDLRFSLEIMPGSRKYVFTPTARAEILTKLYVSFMGQYPHLFLPSGVSPVPIHSLLSEYQASVAYSGAGKEDPLTLGKPCCHIFKKGESCYRCKCVDFSGTLISVGCLYIYIHISTEIVRWTIVVCFVQDASMRQNTLVIMSVSSSPSNQADAAIVVTKRPGDDLLNAHITHQQDHKTRKMLLHVLYSRLSPMIYPQHPITLSV